MNTFNESANNNKKTKTLVVMPEYTKLPDDVYQTAVVPPSAHVTAKQMVTYGFGPQNTITLSSRSEDGCLLSLQRDIVTTGGQRLERQEIPLPPLKTPETALAAAGALLIAGCPPEELYEAMLPLGL